MRNLKKNLSGLMVIFVLLSACSNPSGEKISAPQEELTVFVAASLTDVITVLADSIEKDLNTKLKLNLASSGTLARQLNEGMRCDIYFSASRHWMDYVAQHRLIDSTTLCSPAKNKLVLIAPRGRKDIGGALAALPQVLRSRLSIGDPAHVPAGKYAEEAIKSMGMYDQLKDRLLPAKDVRSALMIVELGEVDFGIVYKTDALKSEKVKVTGVFPDSSHSPIDYHTAVLKSSMKKDLATKVIKYLTGQKSKKTWKQFGFTPVL
ncbi:molybdate ABC transporter substrate-binding protein [Marinilabilia rubra]|uniref:Molybdate ABC transporter substrate-binding protein n=1 Tax=Marinilabilia rubra TaxID=2162893 RepID=A0A2U2BD53_9BACT|nr:molybdate ABC transporter substrate-binding protein [Marinilabilia rubra]PWE00957.1 molybdate ABC transporter substrate-binding protein [Marinilabilia rubra]